MLDVFKLFALSAQPVPQFHLSVQLKLPELNRLPAFSLACTKKQHWRFSSTVFNTGQQVAVRHRAGRIKFKAAQWIGVWEVLQSRRKQT